MKKIKYLFLGLIIFFSTGTSIAQGGLLKKINKGGNKVEQLDSLVKTKNDPYKGTVHADHIGKIMFSKSTIELGAEDINQFTNNFSFGDIIKFRTYYAQSPYNSMVDYYHSKGIFKDSAMALGNGSFWPLVMLNFYVDGKLITDHGYKSDYNGSYSPPMLFSGQGNMEEFALNYTTYRGTLFDTEYAHQEIEDFTEILAQMTPGKHTIKLEVYVRNSAMTSEKSNKYPELYKLILAEGEFSFDYKFDSSMKDNEALCLPKSKVNLESQMTLIKNYLDDKGVKYQKLALAEVYTSSDSEGKYKRTKASYGLKDAEKCNLIYLVFEQRYNYVLGKYNEELVIVKKDVSEIPCGCLD